MEKKLKKKPHFKPQPGSQPFCLQPRDIEILKLVYEMRFASTQHIGYLIPGSYQKIQYRLRGLYDERYLDRPPEQNARRNNRTQHYVYGLGYRGALLLKQEHGFSQIRGEWTKKNRDVVHNTIMHQLMIADFRTALTLALEQGRGGQIVFWEQRHDLADEVKGRPDAQAHGRPIRHPVRPDAWFIIRSRGKDYHFFLEADNSTMRLDRFLKKPQGYFWYWMAGQDAYKDQLRRKHNTFGRSRKIRVLTIAKTPERMANLREVTRKADPKKKGSAMFWFACTRDYSLAEPGRVLENIWITARDKQKMALFEG